MGTENTGTPLEVVDFLNIQKIETLKDEVSSIVPEIVLHRSQIGVLQYTLYGTDKRTGKPFTILIEESGILIDGLGDAERRRALGEELKRCYTGMNSES